ncbi:hypothetical protein SAMN04488511_110147 [Pedobacter suwonensis]|uniref:Uncharacterized protein n=1 Tax=Pedobacter suwonensis TaxID=332999 RepID=A0A1I0TIW7_9SPHI|nr:hypothetical protein SAMN04488511_110147 [Pedobacter suwonensis]
MKQGYCFKRRAKLISYINTEITEEIKIFRVFCASVANITLWHVQKEPELTEKS